MSWIEHHRVSERLASEAQAELRQDHGERARALYARAADAEFDAIRHLHHAKARTLGISWLSVASLYYKAGMHDRAAEVAWSGLHLYRLPDFAKQELRNLLQSICGVPAVAAAIMAGAFRTRLTPKFRSVSQQLTGEATTTTWPMAAKDEYEDRPGIAIDPHKFEQASIMSKWNYSIVPISTLKPVGVSGSRS